MLLISLKELLSHILNYGQYSIWIKPVHVTSNLMLSYWTWANFFYLQVKMKSCENTMNLSAYLIITKTTTFVITYCSFKLWLSLLLVLLLLLYLPPLYYVSSRLQDPNFVATATCLKLIFCVCISLQFIIGMFDLHHHEKSMY